MLRLVVVLLSLLCAGCVGSYIDMRPVDPRGWHKPVSVVVENEDTVAMRSLSVAVRYNDSFASDTLSVDIQTSLPDARQCCERMLLKFEPKYDAAAVVSSQSIAYRDKVQFDQCGYYIFTITPCRNVKGIEAVGVEIK